MTVGRSLRPVFRRAAAACLASVLVVSLAGAQPAPAGSAPTTDAPPATAAATTTPPVAAAPAAAPASGPTLHLASPSPVSLEKRSAGTTAWAPVCDSPCDVPVDMAAQYRVTGPELNPSDAFYLQAPATGDATTLKVRVDPSKQSKQTTGIVLLGVGGALTIGGVIVLALGSTAGQREQETNSTDNQTHTSHTDAMFAGTAMVIAGVAAGVTGGAYLLDSATRVFGPVRAVDDPATRDRVAKQSRALAATRVAPRPAAEARSSSHDRSFSESSPRFVSIPVLGGTF